MVDFLQHFVCNNDGFIAISVGHPDEARYLQCSEVAGLSVPTDKDVYFGPAIRASRDNKKTAVLGSKVLWIDVDEPHLPQLPYPASLIVHSGHGWHIYWELTALLEPSMVEVCNKVLIRCIPSADKACWNANRLLRIPGTMNTSTPPAPVELRKTTGVLYQSQDFIVLSKLDDKALHRLRTGDRRGFRSRSERDWAVIHALVEAGAEDRLIQLLFKHQPIGDKVNDPTTSSEYLPHSIAKARSGERHERDTGKQRSQGGGEIEEQPDGYYSAGGRGARRVSTFTFTPKLLLDGSRFSAEDALLGDVSAAGYGWSNIVFPRAAFTSVSRMDRATPVAAWQWLGRDEDVRKLLPYLLDRLREQGLPRVVATPTMGLHGSGDALYFVGDCSTLSASDVWDAYSGPMACLPTGKERPSLDFGGSIQPGVREKLGDLLPRLNHPESIWPMIGWYFATPLKPWFESKGYRFPILNVAGTKGSGKTTLIQRVFMPLLGQKDPRTYDANTTRFVTLALLGSSNAVPIAFSEFRYSSVQGFIRYILLSYDTGHDPRGRGDQTTVDYPLSAPFSVDGEDVIGDPAAQERIVVALLSPKAVVEGGDCHNAYKEWQQLDHRGFAMEYIQFAIECANNHTLDEMVEQELAVSMGVIPQRLPVRVRNNHIVARVGVRLFCSFTGCPVPPFETMLVSIGTVHNLKSQRSRVMVDDFTEAVVNGIFSGVVPFNFNTKQGIWFQMAPAHDWWLTKLRSSGRTGLERTSIIQQLRETDYFVDAKTIDGTFMYGIDPLKAVECGLDVSVPVRKVSAK